MTAVEFETGYVYLIARQFLFLSPLHESELHKYLASLINKITDHESKDKTSLMESQCNRCMIHLRPVMDLRKGNKCKSSSNMQKKTSNGFENLPLRGLKILKVNFVVDLT